MPEIDADPEQLKEVIVNLVVNACEAMERGGSIVIREQESMTPSKDRIAVIRVSDNGPGIPESIREKVLQPFFTTKEEGTGLGLSIAVRIIEEHHGRLDIESNQDEGATFVISLPHCRNQAMSTILIIDDDDQLRKSFRKLLSEEGYTAEGAASGEAGLEMVRNRVTGSGHCRRPSAGDEWSGNL